MANVKRVGTLEIGEDLPFQQRAWIVQRIGWFILGLLLLAALVGLFGRGGPLASASVGNADSLQLEYDRFARRLTPTTLNVDISGGGEEARVWIDRKYLEGVAVEQITPEPDEVQAAEDRLVYVFKLAEDTQASSVAIQVRPEHLGARSGRIGLDEAEPLTFSQFVYP